MAETWTVNYKIIIKTRPRVKKVERGKILSDERVIKSGTLEANSLGELRTLINKTSHKWLHGIRGAGRTMSHDMNARSSTGREEKI